MYTEERIGQGRLNWMICQSSRPEVSDHLFHCFRCASPRGRYCNALFIQSGASAFNMSVLQDSCSPDVSHTTHVIDQLFNC